MIEDGDRVMVCVSGGKDSYALLDILIALRAARADRVLELVAVNLDQKQPGFPARRACPSYLARLRRRSSASSSRTPTRSSSASIPEGKTMCSLCSRAAPRRPATASRSELGATKIALGHHRDDMVADALHEHVLRRPAEGDAAQAASATTAGTSSSGRWPTSPRRDLERWAVERDFPIIPCNLCGSQQNLQRRQHRRDAARLGARGPGRIDRIFDAMARVVPSHLMDRKLFRFAELQPTGVADAEGDRAFDERCRRPVPGEPPMTRRSPPSPQPPRSRGCASLNDIDADVSSFSRWPAGRAPATYAFERLLPSQQTQPQQAQMLEDAARPRDRRHGLRSGAPKGSVADVTMPARRAHHRDRAVAVRRSVLVRRLSAPGTGFGYGRLRRALLGPHCGPYWSRY